LIASQLPNPYSNIPTSNIESSGTSHWTPQWTLLAGAVRRNLKDEHKILIAQHRVGAYLSLRTCFASFSSKNSIKHNESYHNFFPTKTMVYNCILFLLINLAFVLALESKKTQFKWFYVQSSVAFPIKCLPSITIKFHHQVSES